MGFSIDDNIHESKHNDHKRRPGWSTPLDDKHRANDLRNNLIDELINTNRRSDLLESQTPLIEGPVASELHTQEPTVHRYADGEFDCQKFQWDIKAVSPNPTTNFLLNFLVIRANDPSSPKVSS